MCLDWNLLQLCVTETHCGAGPREMGWVYIPTITEVQNTHAWHAWDKQQIWVQVYTCTQIVLPVHLVVAKHGNHPNHRKQRWQPYGGPRCATAYTIDNTQMMVSAVTAVKALVH